MKSIACFLLLLTFMTKAFAYETDGYAKYKLIFVRENQLNFNPNQDILNPSLQEKKETIIKEKLMSTLIGGMIPLSQEIRFDNQSNTMDSITSSASVIAKKLFLEFKNMDINPEVKFQTFLIPFSSSLGPQNNLFYNSYKVSSSGIDIVNYLKVPIGHPSFSKNVSESINSTQKFYFENAPKFGPIYLLGLSNQISLSGSKRILKTNVLIGIRPKSEDFNNVAPLVTFKKIEIPDINDDGERSDLNALVEFTFDLTNNSEDYKAKVSFGSFDKFINGHFVLKNKNKNLWAPRLVGNINKPHLSMIAANFAIPEIIFDLKQRQVVGLTTYTRLGFEFKNTRLLFGGLQLGKVDREFSTEINRQIDIETEKAVNLAISKAKDLIINKVLGNNINL